MAAIKSIKTMTGDTMLQSTRAVRGAFLFVSLYALTAVAQDDSGDLAKFKSKAATKNPRDPKRVRDVRNAAKFC